MALGLNTSVAPDWANKWSEALAKVFATLVSVRLQEIADVASLPDPARWKYRTVLVLDINGSNLRALAVSDGVDWIRTDTGAVV